MKIKGEQNPREREARDRVSLNKSRPRMNQETQNWIDKKKGKKSLTIGNKSN